MGLFDDIVGSPDAQVPVAPRTGLFDDIVNPTSAFQRGYTDFMNQGPAAAQGTSPSAINPKNLISDKIFETDAGDIHYHDPMTGKVVPTDQKAHVVLRDPSDNKLKVFARTPESNANPVEGVSRILSQGLMTTSPTRLPGGFAGRAGQVSLEKPPVPTTEQLFQAGTAGYNSPAVKDLKISSSPIGEWAVQVQQKLLAEGKTADDFPIVWKKLQALEQAPPGAFQTGDNLNSLYKSFGESAKKGEQAAATVAMRSLNEFLPGVPEGSVMAGSPGAAQDALTQARGNWSAGKASEALDAKRYRAELRTANGGDYGKALQQRVTDILLDPKQSMGLSDDVLQKMEEVVKGTADQKVLRSVGEAISGFGGLSIGMSAGFAIGGTAGAALGPIVPVLGRAMRGFANSMSEGQVAKLSEVIRDQSPLGQQMRSSVLAWQKYADAVTKVPITPRTMAMLNIQARNMANNLKDADIGVEPTDLIRGLQGPVHGSSEQEQR